MGLIRSLCIAFSLYSRIPVPAFTWKEEDMKYTFCFFPWVGGVIGALLYLWKQFCVHYEAEPLTCALICTAIPLILTGGFHVDGFMDTSDALCSYRTKEKKLEILKDSHIGAFAVIRLLLYGLIYIASYLEIEDLHLFGIVCSGFFFSRCLSAIAALSFPHAKKEGNLSYMADHTVVKATRYILYLESILCISFMIWISPKAILIILSALLSFLYYYRRTKKEFGGITGDTAGYFVLLSEGSMAATAALINLLL